MRLRDGSSIDLRGRKNQNGSARILRALSVQKKLIELWNREFYSIFYLNITVPTFLLLAPCPSVVYVFSYVSGLCVLQLGMGNAEPLVPEPRATDVALPLSCEY